MKKLVSIFSAFIFLVTTAGYYLGFSALRNEVQQHMATLVESSLSEQHVTHFTFSEVGFRNQVHFTSASNHEFIFNGELYDVVESNASDGKIFITCIADKKETSLVSFFSQHLTEQSPSNDSAGKISVKPISPDWIFQSKTNSNFSLAFAFLSNSEATIPASSVTEILSPPPKA